MVKFKTNFIGPWLVKKKHKIAITKTKSRNNSPVAEVRFARKSRADVLVTLRFRDAKKSKNKCKFN